MYESHESVRSRYRDVLEVVPPPPSPSSLLLRSHQQLSATRERERVGLIPYIIACAIVLDTRQPRPPINTVVKRTSQLLQKVS